MQEGKRGFISIIKSQNCIILSLQSFHVKLYRWFVSFWEFLLLITVKIVPAIEYFVAWNLSLYPYNRFQSITIHSTDYWQNVLLVNWWRCIHSTTMSFNYSQVCGDRGVLWSLKSFECKRSSPTSPTTVVTSKQLIVLSYYVIACWFIPLMERRGD